MNHLTEFFDSIRNTEHILIRILDAIGFAVLIADSNDVICYTNPIHGSILGVHSEDIIGMKLQDIWKDAVLPATIESGNAKSGVFLQQRGFEYISDLFPIKVNGNIIGGIAITQEVTKFNRISRELKRYRKKADHLSKILAHAYEASYDFQAIIGESQIMHDTITLAKKAAGGNSNIVITGESGTGKEMVAQAIHNQSDRSEGPFVAVNCAAIASSLVESELFGYEDGAFTGGKKGGQIGLFEIADGGTIFLDEIADLGLEIQSKLLRVLQERKLRRIGSVKEKQVNVRALAATNQDLRVLVRDRKFREDLYYRLNVITIHLPPLRQRGDDILLLTRAFLLEHGQRIGAVYQLADSTKTVLMEHNWPGNIRELRNAIEYAINMSNDGTILPEHLPDGLQPLPKGNSSGRYADLVRDFERRIVKAHLNRYGCSLSAKKRIAQEMDISLATLYKKLNALGLTAERRQTPVCREPQP